jgi:hypothetical protein
MEVRGAGGHVACGREEAYTVLVGERDQQRQLRNGLGVNEKIILKWIFKN